MTICFSLHQRIRQLPLPTTTPNDFIDIDELNLQFEVQALENFNDDDDDEGWQEIAAADSTQTKRRPKDTKLALRQDWEASRAQAKVEREKWGRLQDKHRKERIRLKIASANERTRERCADSNPLLRAYYTALCYLISCSLHCSFLCYYVLTILFLYAATLHCYSMLLRPYYTASLPLLRLTKLQLCRYCVFTTLILHALPQSRCTSHHQNACGRGYCSQRSRARVALDSAQRTAAHINH